MMEGSMHIEEKRTEVIMPNCDVCGEECEKTVNLSDSESMIDPESIDVCKDCLKKALEMLE